MQIRPNTLTRGRHALANFVRRSTFGHALAAARFIELAIVLALSIISPQLNHGITYFFYLLFLLSFSYFSFLSKLVALPLLVCPFIFLDSPCPHRLPTLP
jgi:hypothetical protein